ncbi:hypothetical protein J437_LFUL005735 [Ladona fulva]|uniref:C2H2-type domain-containing protein n=1 Tax=Ladona fulva TaxID=123851 RepID=A0A8K0K0S3_LADFU|nr:hypothetical protein J437_LFUL005735 [Ladona fulva]
MENASELCCDNQLNLKSNHQKFSGGKKTRKQAKYVETRDTFPTCKHPKVINGADIPKVAISTNGTCSFTLERGNSSALFSHHDNKNNSSIMEWNVGKNSAAQAERSDSEDSALVSQAQTLIDLFHEVFRTSSTPLQIVLEPHKSGDVLYLEQKLGDVEENLPIKESEEIKDHHFVSMLNEEKGKGSKFEHGYSLENNKELSTLQLIHRCFYCSFGSEAISLVVEHIKSYHPNKQLRTKTISGRNCPYCGLRLEQSAFFQHMRQYHGDAHPFRCGYCSFMGRDLNQVKHHCSKKHPAELFKCFRRSNSVPSYSQLDEDGVLGLNSKDTPEGDDGKEKDCISEEFDENGEEFLEEVETSERHDCPVCKKKFKTLKYLKVHMRVHSRVRFKCGYCSYLSVYFLQVLQHCKKRHKMLQPRVLKKGSRQPADPDTRKWARKYSCPHCDYTCSYGASYRRHLTLHTSTGLPFRCKYCPYEGREKYYVRRHIQRVHRGCPLVVVENEPRDLNVSSKVKISNYKKGKEPKLPKKLKSEKKLNPENTASPPCTEVSSCSKERKSPEGGVRLDLGKLVEELHSYSEEFETEGVEGLKMEEKRSDVGGDGHPIKLLTKEKVVPKGKKKAVNNVVIEELAYPVTATNQEEIMHILSWNDMDNVENIQLNKSKKAHSRKPTLKKVPIIKSSLESKTPILLPKILTPTLEETNKISENNTVPNNNQDKNLLKNESSTRIESIETYSEKSLDKNLTVSNKEPSSSTTRWREIILEDSVPTHFPDNIMALAGDMYVCKKKKNKEKSTHKIKKFLARKEGKHSFCICGARTVNKAFYKHIKKHLDFKPYGCGYCYYRSIERAKVRVHHAFVHPGVPLIVKEYWDDKKEDLEERENEKLGQELGTTSNIDVVSNVSSQNVLEKSSPRHRATVDFHCPICGKKISFHSYTIRRHIFAHYDYRPYQCGQCDFRGCSPGEVKQHSVYHGADICPVVISSGQQPPDGLEQLVDDCFKNMRTKALGNSTKRKAVFGYKLATKEAISWQETLTQGKCPWCKVYISLCDRKTKSLARNDIDSHFKLHFYKPMENASDASGLEGISVPPNPPSSLEEKDAIIMNGLMNYFIHQPMIEDLEMEYPKDMDCGERGIISCPDGMPEGTIQIADSLLADLRHLLWGQEAKPSSRKSRKTNQKQGLNSGATEMVELNSEEFQGQFNHHQLQTNGDTRNKQYPLWGIVEANGNSQTQDGEVGVLLLGDDIEMTTAVVVVNPEVKDSADVEVEVSI